MHVPVIGVVFTSTGTNVVSLLLVLRHGLENGQQAVSVRLEKVLILAHPVVGCWMELVAN